MPDQPEFDQLGNLELAVLNALWAEQPADVHTVLANLEWDRQLAYTTVMTVLTRLLEKGLVARERAGRRYLYEATVDRASLGRSRMGQIVRRVYGGLVGRAVHELLSNDSEISEEELDALEELIKERRGRSEV